MGLNGREGDRRDDVVDGAAAGEVVARFREALQDGERFRAADALRDLVADVSSLQVWENQHVGMAGHGASLRFGGADFRNDRGVELHFAVQREIGGHFVGETGRLLHFRHEFMLRAAKFGKVFCNPPELSCPQKHWQPTIDPEAAKVIMDEMIAENKVEMFFHSWGVDVIQDGDSVKGVVFESKQGRQAILAKQVVDCTGDADMLFLAGGDYSQVTSPISTVFRWANMDTINPPQGAKPHFPLHGNEGNPDARWGHCGMKTGNGLSVRDLSRLEVAFRRKNWNDVLEMRKTPGWEKVYTSNSASQIGPRQSRLIAAEYVMGRKEIVEENDKFSDCIGWCGVDGPHKAFRVSYRQVLPKKVENLLCAGRCLGKGDSIDTFRLIAPCFMTGQAAGIAAGLAVQKGVTPRALAYSEIAKALDAQNVYHD